MESKPNRSNSILIWGAAAVAILLPAIVVLIQSRSRSRGNSDGTGVVANKEIRKLSNNELQEIYSLKNTGIGHLENERVADAISVLGELREKLPHEPLAIRNLAIAEFLRFEKSGDSEVYEKILADLKQVEPGQALVYWLEAKFATKMRDQAIDDEEQKRFQKRLVTAFQNGARASPDDGIFPFELYQECQFSQDPTERDLAKSALNDAVRLAPKNLFVLGESLRFRASTRDPSLADEVERAKNLLAPYALAIEVQHNHKILEQLDRASELLATNDIARGSQIVRGCMNLVMPQLVVQSDRRRISNVHPLKFVSYEFSPEFVAKNPAPDLESTPQINVRFQIESNDFPALPAVIKDIKWEDVDLDGTLDLLVLAEDKFTVYKRDEIKGPWRVLMTNDVTGGLDTILIADLDRDDIVTGTSAPNVNKAPGPEACFAADPDVVLAGSSGVRVLRNVATDQQSRVFELIPQPDALAAVRGISAASLVDFDHDGDLDLVTSSDNGTSLWANFENMTFQDASKWSALPPTDQRFNSFRIVDLDRDVDLDIVCSGQPGQPSGYLENLLHGQMRWHPFEGDWRLASSQIDCAIIDADRNGSWDLVSLASEGVSLTRTNVSASGQANVAGSGRVHAAEYSRVIDLDFDNDGFRDLLLVGSSRTDLLRGLANSQFAANSVAELPACDRADVGDIDDDGDLDLCMLSDGKILFAINEGGNQNKHLVVRAFGANDPISGRVNHNGIGSLIEIKSGTAYQAQVATKSTTHFGLGQTSSVDVVRVLLTNGFPQSAIRPSNNAKICERQVAKGSCPFLYTWDGEKFSFVSDCLWAAPIGLQFAPGVYAPSRPWEYLKIDGHLLQPRNGRYELRITEELWEATYLDQIELFAVDHPAGTEIYTNEKVGPPELAAHQVHTVRQRRLPVAARDKFGNNVLPEITHRDNRFARCFRRTFRQGLAEPHYLELDLGDLGSPDQIKLFLTGWIYPTDTSINIALAQNPNLDAPRPPSVWVPDDAGEWKESIPYMGFPGGKTKTMVVDLSKAFLTKDYRIRIATSQEIYWDDVFITVDDPEVETRTHMLKLLAADVHYRGFSAPLPKGFNCPEQYDYDHCSSDPKWPPMGGLFTRYGNVLELLQQTDARSVVFGSGDEVSISFSECDAVMPGWQRDFILRNVGWDKDADLNSVFGQTVEPLPFSEMTRYPYDGVQEFPSDEIRQNYLRTYQTRAVNGKLFWNWVRQFEPQHAN